MDTFSQAAATAYLNPVYPQTFPDPFVLKYRGQYWAYCTGLQADGKAFGILRSPDLVRWQAVGSAMAPLPGDHPCYWAPEVTYDNGRFFLYYSVGNEETMHIRVAVAASPAGPFLDSGRRLTTEPFAIDPHLFSDDDGRRYLFYATDFYDHPRVGTGTVRDRLLDPFTLAGRPQPVALPRYDWQVYDPQREEKGGVRWHTIEGPFVLKHKATYYQIFSGGNWQNPSYGVAYAVTKDVDIAGEWFQVADGERVPPILRTVPGRVHGPGHNSVVRGPDNRQNYCIYHRWANGERQEPPAGHGSLAGQGPAGRVLAIDPLDWAGDRMIVLGPSHTPQAAPLQPHFADFLPEQERETLEPAWESYSGDWIVRDGAAMPRAVSPTAEIRYTVPEVTFVAEVSVAGESRSGRWGLTLGGEEKEALLKFRLEPGAGSTTGFGAFTWQSPNGERERRFPLPSDFNFTAYHLLRLEVDYEWVSVTLGETQVVWRGTLSETVAHIALCSEGTRGRFSGFSITTGWQDLFMEHASPTGRPTRGWRDGGRGSEEQWRIADRRLSFQGDGNGESSVVRGPLLDSYELTANARLEERHDNSGCYGFLPALTAAGNGPLLTVTAYEKGWRLNWQYGDAASSFALPPNFDAHIYQQFRFRKEQGNLTVSWEGQDIAAGPIDPAPAEVGLFGRRAAVAFDLVRVTAIPLGEALAAK